MLSSSSSGCLMIRLGPCGEENGDGHRSPSRGSLPSSAPRGLGVPRLPGPGRAHLGQHVEVGVGDEAGHLQDLVLLHVQARHLPHSGAAPSSRPPPPRAAPLPSPPQPLSLPRHTPHLQVHPDHALPHPAASGHGRRPPPAPPQPPGAVPQATEATAAAAEHRGQAAKRRRRTTFPGRPRGGGPRARAGGERGGCWEA